MMVTVTAARRWRSAASRRTAPDATTASLKGWTLKDDDGHRYRFGDVRLAGRATVRIHTGEGRDIRTDLFQDRRNYVWDNDRDKATLRDDRDRTIDTSPGATATTADRTVDIPLPPHARSGP